MKEVTCSVQNVPSIRLTVSVYYWPAYNGSVLFCLRASVVVVCYLSSSVTLPAEGPAGLLARGRSGGRLHGGPVWLRPIRATSF